MNGYIRFNATKDGGAITELYLLALQSLDSVDI